MYPEEVVQPMREELTSIGFRELRTPDEVDSILKRAEGTALVVVNSICGCAAGKARPAVALALSRQPRPDTLCTVFAGQDREATEAARKHFTGYPPSSPSIGILRDGQLVYMMQRSDIEASSPEMIASALAQAFEKHCAKEAISQ